MGIQINFFGYAESIELEIGTKRPGISVDISDTLNKYSTSEKYKSSDFFCEYGIFFFSLKNTLCKSDRSLLSISYEMTLEPW